MQHLINQTESRVFTGGCSLTLMSCRLRAEIWRFGDRAWCLRAKRRTWAGTSEMTGCGVSTDPRWGGCLERSLGLVWRNVNLLVCRLDELSKEVAALHSFFSFFLPLPQGSNMSTSSITSRDVEHLFTLNPQGTFSFTVGSVGYTLNFSSRWCLYLFYLCELVFFLINLPFLSYV